MTKIFDKLKQLNPWHFVWISIVSSELITLVLSVVQGRLWWGSVSRETLIIGAVDSLVVPLVVATVVIYFVKHIAALQESNARLQEANRKLQGVDRMKSDFISLVSHELRTPLTTIKALVELISMKPGMPNPQKTRIMATINVETDRLIRLIVDLLDLSRIEAGYVAWRSEDVSLEEVITNSLSCMGPLFENKGISLTTAISPSGLTVPGDRDRLIQVMTNILSNAVKFTPSGGAVHVAALSEGGQVVVEVSDTGSGVAAQELERIFEKFHRSRSRTATAIEGTGLGLAISRQIVDYHGGKIWAVSEAGKGSTFFITFPAATGRDAQASP